MEKDGIISFKKNLECLIKKIDGCKNKTENSFITKVGKHIPSSFTMSKISSFKRMINKNDAYRSKDCMKKFCESLREQTKLINYFLKNEVISKKAAEIL